MKQDQHANILTYCQWRGDLRMDVVPFCHVDNLIFCCLSYLNWNGIAEYQEPQQAIPLYEAARQWFDQPVEQQKMRVKTDMDLLHETANSVRFGNVKLFRYVDRFSESKFQQFSAISFLLDKDTVYVAYRGTDNTLAGWREDFHLSFMPKIPSQEAAVAYLQEVMDMGFSRVYIGGHSKGGNLAVYAAIHVKCEELSVICGVYNNDGPGFSIDLDQNPQFQKIKDRVFTFVPQASVVGMLLEHAEDYQVVYSVQKGLLQHDPYSWNVIQNDWHYLDEITPASKFLDSSLRTWIMDMTPEERERLTNSIFHVLQSETNARTFQDLMDGGTSTISGIIRAWNDMPQEARQFMQKMLKKLFRIVRRLAMERKNIVFPETQKNPMLLEKNRDGKEEDRNT